jgi:hypothetical protein
MTWVLVMNLATAWAMTGVIWTMQLVHYPVLATASAAAPAEAVRRHRRGITPIVAPLMAAELIGACLLIADASGAVSRPGAILAAALLAGSLGLTALYFAPLHGRLARRHDDADARRLVSVNWFRTIAWTLRAAVLTLAAVV